MALCLIDLELSRMGSEVNGAGIANQTFVVFADFPIRDDYDKKYFCQSDVIP